MDNSLYSQNLRFSPPYGLASEVVNPVSAKRVYYNSKGLPICRLLLHKDLAEPRITWRQYNVNDRVTGLFAYDTWDNLTTVHDLTPAPVHYRLQASVNKVDQDVIEPTAGRLIGASADQAPVSRESLDENNDEDAPLPSRPTSYPAPRRT